MAGDWTLHCSIGKFVEVTLQVIYFFLCCTLYYNVKFSYYFITVHLFWNRKFSRSNTGLVNLSIGPALAGL